MTKSKTQEERFWEKVDKTGGPDACWLWTASKGKSGNGNVKFNGKSTQARRVAYELEFGPIQEGLLVRVGQDCNPTCVNPDHLEAMTRSKSNRINGSSHLTPEERFWAKVDKTGGPKSCWIWTASKTKYGPGYFNFDGTLTPARRVAYELKVGPIDAGLEIRAGQNCDPTCVNPAHLVPMTKSEGGSISGKHQLTHCQNGHLFTERNTAYTKGAKYCIICRIDWHKAEVERLSSGPAPDPEDRSPDREPVYPELWGSRTRVIGDRVVDEKFERRFWKKVDRTEDAKACWPWTNATDSGYGIFYISNNKVYKKRTQAHIVAYQLEVGPIPEGLVIDHFRCGNKLCCNPSHLEPVTPSENTRRAHKRRPYCERGHPHNEDNSYFTDTGKRYCRACRYLASIEYLNRKMLGRGTNRNAPMEERFWRLVDWSDGADACWPWTGKIIDAKGYGYFSDKKKHRVHRLAWELKNGRPIPDGKTIDHTCRNKICCNPDHLEAVSVEENSRRAARFKASSGQSTEARFWAYTDTSEEPDACWIWKNESLTLWDSESGKSTNPRRFIYQHKIGPIPNGKRVRDRCGEPKCVNYRHLVIRGEIQEIPKSSCGQLAFSI